MRLATVASVVAGVLALATTAAPTGLNSIYPRSGSKGRGSNSSRFPPPVPHASGRGTNPPRASSGRRVNSSPLPPPPGARSSSRKPPKPSKPTTQFHSTGSSPTLIAGYDLNGSFLKNRYRTNNPLDVKVLLSYDQRLEHHRRQKGFTPKEGFDFTASEAHRADFPEGGWDANAGGCTYCQSARRAGYGEERYH